MSLPYVRIVSMNTMKRIWMQVSRSSVAARNPYLAAQWHPHRNSGVSPDEVKYEEVATSYWWQCGNNSAHVWESPLSVRIRSNGVCPFCEQAAFFSNSALLADAFPSVRKEWNPALNPGEPLVSIPVDSRQKFVWQCQVNRKHTWEATPFARAFWHADSRRDTVRGCPRCELKMSKVTVSQRKGVGVVA